MNDSPSPGTSKRKNPLLYALLNIPVLGLGYLFLGFYARFFVTYGIIAGFMLLNLVLMNLFLRSIIGVVLFFLIVLVLIVFWVIVDSYKKAKFFEQAQTKPSFSMKMFMILLGLISFLGILFLGALNYTSFSHLAFINPDQLTPLGLQRDLSAIQDETYRTELDNLEVTKDEDLPLPLSTSSETLLYKGAWFDIAYPSDFTIHERELTSEDHSSSGDYDGVAFSSPDEKVEFYIYSPLRSGTSQYEYVLANEIISLEEIPERTPSGDFDQQRTIERKTFSDKNGEYSRSYQKTYDYWGTHSWTIGIKYKAWEDYQRYLAHYLVFKQSLVQYTDH
ncbi:MAG: hypothetical protein AB7J40_04545 [Candidatus Altimarinota bacterium]